MYQLTKINGNLAIDWWIRESVSESSEQHYMVLLLHKKESIVKLVLAFVSIQVNRDSKMDSVIGSFVADS